MAGHGLEELAHARIELLLWQVARYLVQLLIYLVRVHLEFRQG